MNELKNLEEVDTFPKGHYETVQEYYKEVPTYDENGEQTGTEKVVTGRDVKWVWDDPIEIENQRLTGLRTKREPLLNAFDKWEKAVLRGREQDDYIIMTWYNNLLDLKEIAFENVPERIKYYL